MAGSSEKSSLAPALRADIELVAEPGRAVVHGLDRAETTARRLLEREGAHRGHDCWADNWNDDPKPFVWHKAADEIIDKVRRGRTKAPPDQIRDGPLVKDHRLNGALR